MGSLELARWQFAITTIYHFIFVPITIGSGFLVAGLQTAWYRTGNEKYYRATKFFGKLFLINFALGVVTGIVQEFQFGMNWSTYSRFVGDVFGAPLAMEGLLAFFLESTFLGLWIFGWDYLSKKLHLATIWLAATGTLVSAYFILAANSWMQHPVGYRMDPIKHRAELTNIFAVLFQKTTLSAFFHTISSTFLASGALFAGIAGYLLLKGKHVDIAKPVLKVGLITTIVSFLLVGASGDYTARVMTSQQPMKMAAAEALYNSESNAPFSLFTIGSLDGNHSVFQIGIPSFLSIMSHGSPSAKVDGINDLQSEYQTKYGPGSYKPVIWLAYWSFRLMIGFGGLATLIALYALWKIRREKFTGKWLARSMIALPFLPLIGISFGWIFTESARQPWIVFGLQKTATAVSPRVNSGEVWTTMLVFTLLYGILAVIEFGLMLRTIKVGPENISDAKDQHSENKSLTMAY
jgi:cytochrome bd ubiquinol oxidase subunit I